MSIPKINLRDGKHKLIVAEEGERVLTPEQNQTYEAQHPDARKNPMTAKVYDEGGAVDAAAAAAKKAAAPSGEGQAGHLADAYLADAASPVELGPQMNQKAVYDKGGRLPSVPQRIEARANDLLDQQAQADSEAEQNSKAIRAKYEQIQALKAQGEAQNAPSTEIRPYGPPVEADRIDPNARYGVRSGEQRLDPQGNAINPTTPAGLGAVGPQRPVPTALGNKLPVYDEGGKVKSEAESEGQDLSKHPGESALDVMQQEESNYRTHERAHPEPADRTTPEGMGVKPLPRPSVPMNKLPLYDDGGTVSKDDNDPDKAAAYHQAVDEVMNNVPLRHGGMQEREAATSLSEHRYPQPEKPVHVQGDLERPLDESKGEPAALAGGAKMNTDNAPLGKPVMNTQNATPWEENPMQEASTKRTPLGPQVAPRGTQMNALPSGPIKDDIDQAVAKGDMSTGAPKPPTPQEIIAADKMDAMKSGDLVKLGMAHINERSLASGGPPALPQPTAPTAQENVVNQEKELKDKMINGATEQERFQAEKDLAEFKRRNPWGSEGNRPGLGGKIGHVLGRVGQAALSATAPYVNEAIPGSQVQLAEQAARGETGVEQAQKKEQQAAVTKEAEQQPALREEAQKLTAQKQENTLNLAGYKTDPTTGLHVPLKYEEMSPQQQAKADKDESVQTLNEAKGHEQEAKAVLERYKADPNNAQNQVALKKLQLEGQKIALAAGTLGIHQKEFLRDTYGVDEKGEPIPGVQTTDEGKPIGVKVGKGNEATSQRLNKADLSQNVQLNATNAIKMIQDNPDLFGKVSGRFTNVSQMAGTNDDAIVRLGIEVHNMAVASAGIHGQRGQAAVEAYEKDILNKFHNSPEATISGLKELSGSVQTFIDDAKAGKHVAPTPKTEEEVKTGIPKTATHTYKDKDGKVVGYADGGKYHALK